MVADRSESGRDRAHRWYCKLLRSWCLGITNERDAGEVALEVGRLKLVRNLRGYDHY